MTQDFRAGLPLVLGTDTFGWTSTTADAVRILDRFVSAGGRHLDTSDMYPVWAAGASGRESETIIGEWLAARGGRDTITLASKVGRHPENPGLSRQNVHASVDASLTRLRTDHIDLYYAHADDPTQSPAQLARTFGDLVTSGKVRYIGLSRFSIERQLAWISVARRMGVAVPVAVQPQYSLLHRWEVEGGIGDACRRNDLHVFSYYPLASGLLTGKYRTAADITGAPREHLLKRYVSKAAFEVVDTLIDLSAELNTEPTSVALAWLLAKGITAPIASARVPLQIEAILAASDLMLAPQHVAQLDRVSAPFGPGQT